MGKILSPLQKFKSLGPWKIHLTQQDIPIPLCHGLKGRLPVIDPFNLKTPITQRLAEALTT